MARRTWTDNSIAALKPGSKRRPIPDPQLPGHYVRVSEKGPKTFYAVARDPRGKQVWHCIGSAALYKVEEARELARTAIKAIKAGESRAGPQSFEAVAELWLKRHVDAKGLRTAPQIKAYLNRHVLPEWRSRDFETITRSDVTALLDRVEDASGPVAADKVLTHLSSLFNWQTARHDNYSSPIVRGMRRSNTKERARKRILSDDELRAVWMAAEANGSFGAFVRLLLLTGQRKDKVNKLRWDDITADGAWNIPTEAREKGNAGELVLPQVALDIINAQPRLAGNPYVFAGRGGGPIGTDTRKEPFCAKLPPMPQWGLHDLRRTARSLMTRAGILSEVAERVLGHTIGGVEGIYNRHKYREEMAHALRALAGLIDNIVNPPADNVVSLARAQ